MPFPVHYAHWIFKLLPARFGALTTPWAIYVRDSKKNAFKPLIAHELVHVTQMQKLGALKFYCLYLAEFLVNLIKLKSWLEAYRAISFEKEARKKGL